MNRNLLFHKASQSTSARKPSTGTHRSQAAKPNLTTEVLCITTYPPRECGIATYSQDLVQVLDRKFGESFKLRICPIETATEIHSYPREVDLRLNIDQSKAFDRLAATINGSPEIGIVLLQHEFGLFASKEWELINFLDSLEKPVIVVFHSVLPQPNPAVVSNVLNIVNASRMVIVMTQHSKRILMETYGVPEGQIAVINHGTHLVPLQDKQELKAKYGVQGRRILSTFGLISAGKSIETTLEALPKIIAAYPDILFLIIGKTHPSVVKHEGEQYRQQLEAIIDRLQLQDHVQWVNSFLPLPDLLEYLQLTDIYLFTSKDPHQAVSGTFSYAISCGCPVVSTPIPHVREVLEEGMGILIDFGSSTQLADAVIRLLGDPQLAKHISYNGLHKMAHTAWENAAIAHARLFEAVATKKLDLKYSLPDIKLDHIKRLTTDFGMIQFSKLNQPDPESGFTLDDNARALIALCMHYELTLDETDLPLIETYFQFIQHCLQKEGFFLNYVDTQKHFTDQNQHANLADANGRTVWALGYLISLGDLFPERLSRDAEAMVQQLLPGLKNIHSTRAMAFAIKGLYYCRTKNQSVPYKSTLVLLANRLVQMYRHYQNEGQTAAGWNWYEGYLTYANSVLAEGMLCAWLAIGDPVYEEIAKESFDFLLSKTFLEDRIKVVSNKTWLRREETANGMQEVVHVGGEQAIDVAYTILALNKFHQAFPYEGYGTKMEVAFNWFLGHNHLHQVIYNPSTGGCYDGLESDHVNLNQGAESTLSYLLARLTMERYRKAKPAKQGASVQYRYLPESPFKLA